MEADLCGLAQACYDEESAADSLCVTTGFTRRGYLRACVGPLALVRSSSRPKRPPFGASTQPHVGHRVRRDVDTLGDA